MAVPNASPGVLAASASKLVQVEFVSDEDISMGMGLYREFWWNAAAVAHTYADNLYTALWHYDKQRKLFGSTRAARVTKPLREISYHAELAHRPAMASVMKYQQLYAPDIEQHSKASPKRSFKPGTRAA